MVVLAQLDKVCHLDVVGAGGSTQTQLPEGHHVGFQEGVAMDPYLGHAGGEDVPLDIRDHLVVHVPHRDGGGVSGRRGNDVEGDAAPLVGVQTHPVHPLCPTWTLPW